MVMRVASSLASRSGFGGCCCVFEATSGRAAGSGMGISAAGCATGCGCWNAWRPNRAAIPPGMRQVSSSARFFSRTCLAIGKGVASGNGRYVGCGGALAAGATSFARERSNRRRLRSSSVSSRKRIVRLRMLIVKARWNVRTLACCTLKGKGENARTQRRKDAKNSAKQAKATMDDDKIKTQALWPDSKWI